MKWISFCFFFLFFSLFNELGDENDEEKICCNFSFYFCLFFSSEISLMKINMFSLNYFPKENKDQMKFMTNSRCYFCWLSEWICSSSIYFNWENNDIWSFSSPPQHHHRWYKYFTILWSFPWKLNISLQSFFNRLISFIQVTLNETSDHFHSHFSFTNIEWVPFHLLSKWIEMWTKPFVFDYWSSFSQMEMRKEYLPHLSFHRCSSIQFINWNENDFSFSFSTLSGTFCKRCITTFIVFFTTNDNEKDILELQFCSLKEKNNHYWHFFSSLLFSSPLIFYLILVVSYNQPIFSRHASWNPNAITFANRSVVGSWPIGVFVDINNTLYVACQHLDEVKVWYKGNYISIKSFKGGFVISTECLCNDQWSYLCW